MLQILYENAAPTLHDNLPKAEKFKRALDAAAIKLFLRKGMHVKEIDMGLTSTRASANVSVGHLM